MTQKEFIEEIAKWTRFYAPTFGIKVNSPCIAQAILESTSGTSSKAKHHNYHGLKYRKNRVSCHIGYFKDGGSEQLLDGSYVPLPNETLWYEFANIQTAVLGYFQFINIPNYASTKGVLDPYTYLQNIKKSGYATSLKYVDNVFNIITKYNLTQYDMGVDVMSDILVAIDAGHGSQTAGKRTPDGYREHWINVMTANYCVEALTRCGVKTLKIGWNDTNARDDTDVLLGTRQSIIKKNKCNISVSIHANAYGNGATFNSANGVETLYHLDGSCVKDSKRLATLVQNNLIKGTKQTNRGVKQQSLAMCNCVKMGTQASVLCEIGFMTNKAESDLMKTEAFCKEQGEDIARGICEYLNISYVEANGSPQNSVQTPQNTTQTPSTSSKFPYLVRINVDKNDVLNVRALPSASSVKVTQVRRGEVYTIIAEQNGFLKLKSGAGWISSKYVIKL